MNNLNQAIMRIPWRTNPSLGQRWATIVILFPFGIGALILLFALIIKSPD